MFISGDKMKNIVYSYGDSVYLNLTNKCSCNCDFCIRHNGDGVGSADTLWMHGDPDLDEIISAIDNYDLSGVREVVFCGYGEPTYAFDNLIKTAQYLRNMGIKTRINTNGHSDLINARPTAKILCDNVDVISISLNSCNAKKYNDIVNSIYGEDAFFAMIDFAKECRKNTENVILSVVDVIPKEDIDECQKLADSLNIPLRVREYTE